MTKQVIGGHLGWGGILICLAASLSNLLDIGDAYNFGPLQLSFLGIGLATLGLGIFILVKSGIKLDRSNFVLLVVSTIAAIVMLELTLRIVIPVPDSGFGITDEEKIATYGWGMPAHYSYVLSDPDTGRRIRFRMNSHGWKDVEHTLEKPEGTLRILFLGDSVTWGIVPLEDGYPRRVEQLFHENGYSQIEVISIGISGWGTDQSLEALAVEGIRYQPDVVIYQFTSNDLIDNLQLGVGTARYYGYTKPFRYTISDDNNLVRTEQEVEIPTLSLSERLVKSFRRSAALYYSRNAIDRLLSFLEPEDEEFEAPLDPLNPVSPSSPYFRYHVDSDSQELQEAWALLEAIVVQMQQISEENDALFLILTQDADEGEREAFLRTEIIETDENGDFVMEQGIRYPIDLTVPNQALVAIGKRHNIPVILPMQAYPRYQNDTHPNVEGNLHMAEDVVNYLLDYDPFLEMLRH